LKRQAELEEKLKVCNAKYLGCSAINYEKVSLSSGGSNDAKMVWLCKIEEVENELGAVNSKLRPYFSLLSALNAQEQLVLEKFIIMQQRANFVLSVLKVNRSRLYDIKNNLIRKWQSMTNTVLWG
jgi:hypothetical protein